MVWASALGARGATRQKASARRKRPGTRPWRGRSQTGGSEKAPGLRRSMSSPWPGPDAMVMPALGSRLSALGSRLSALGSRLSALGSRLSALGSRLSALGSRLSALGSRLSALGSRLSALGSRLSALGSRLSALGSRLSALGSRLSALGSRLSALGSRLSALGSSTMRTISPGGFAVPARAESRAGAVPARDCAPGTFEVEDDGGVSKVGVAHGVPHCRRRCGGRRAAAIARIVHNDISQSISLNH